MKYALIIIGGSLVSMIGFGIRGTVGLFIEPITADGSTEATVLSFAFALQNLMWGAFQPIAGSISDRFGITKALIFGAIIYALGLVLMTVGNSEWLYYLSGGFLMGAGVAFTSFALVLSAFAKLLPKHMSSMAFGFGTAAGSAGQFLFAPLGQFFINQYGWQYALYLFGFTVLLIIPLSAILRQKKQIVSQTVINTDEHTELDESKLKTIMAQAFKCPSYQLLAAGFFVCGFHVAFITVHLPVYIAQKFPGSAIIGWSLAIIGLFNIVGSILSGLISSKMKKARWLFIIYFSRAVVITLFILFPMTYISILLFSASMGILWLSTVPPTNGLVLVMFGPKYIATLFGMVLFSHQIGAFLGVYLGGLSFKYFQSYMPLWIAGIVLAILSGLLHLPIKEQRAYAAKLRPAEA